MDESEIVYMEKQNTKENDSKQANTTKLEKRKQRNAPKYDLHYEQSMASAINAQFNRSTKPKQQQTHTEFKQVRSPLKNKTNPQQSPKRRKHSNTKNLKTIRSSKKKSNNATSQQ